MSRPGLPASLRDALASGTLVPFVGAGVSMAVKRKTGESAFPSWHGLLLRAADRLDAEMRDGGSVVRAMLAMNQPRYLDAARYARSGLGNLWADFLMDAFNVGRKDIDSASLELARRVWALNSRLVITTNYDRVLRWACPEQDDIEEVDIEDPTHLLAATRGKLTGPTIWHLHGSISEPAHIILSPDGYELLYPSEHQASAYRAALTTLRNIMANRTLLFVGFSLDDPYLVRQLEWARDVFKGFAGPHYILVRARDADASRAKFMDLGVDVVTFEDFGAPLHERLEELRESTPRPVPDPSTPRPQIPSAEPPTPPRRPARPVAIKSPAKPHAKGVMPYLFGAFLGTLLVVATIVVVESGLLDESHLACESFATQGYFLQLASLKSADHAVSQAAKLEREASIRGIPGKSVLLVRPPFVVVGLTGFDDAEEATRFIEHAKLVLGQGGYVRPWEDYCNEVWSSDDPTVRTRIVELGFNALRGRDHCYCDDRD